MRRTLLLLAVLVGSLLVGAPAQATTTRITPTVTAYFQAGRPDIVRCQVVDSATGKPVYRATVDLYAHEANLPWHWVGRAYTDVNGWCYLAVHPRWWTAYVWAAQASPAMHNGASNIVTTG
jgi:hypothetical protein